MNSGLADNHKKTLCSKEQTEKVNGLDVDVAARDAELCT